MEFVRLPAFGTEQRMAIIGRVDAGDGRKVTIAATHLQNRRSVATRQLAIVLDRLDRRNGPAVLVGDLNLGESDVTPALGARGYSWAHSGPTFPAAAPDRTIDWIGGRGVSIDGTEAVAVVAERSSAASRVRVRRAVDPGLITGGRVRTLTTGRGIGASGERIGDDDTS